MRKTNWTVSSIGIGQTQLQVSAASLNHIVDAHNKSGIDKEKNWQPKQCNCS